MTSIGMGYITASGRFVVSQRAAGQIRPRPRRLNNKSIVSGWIPGSRESPEEFHRRHYRKECQNLHGNLPGSPFEFETEPLELDWPVGLPEEHDDGD